MLPVTNALYQGKIDNFCAAYAVLNALKLIRNISTVQARTLLNAFFFYESHDPENWVRIINHETDYQDVVKRMLEKWQDTFSYESFCPFEEEASKHHSLLAKFEQEIIDLKEKEESSHFLTRLFQKKKIGDRLMARASIDPEITLDTLWKTLQEHCVQGKSTVVLRFCRFIPKQIGPLVDHWTTLIHIDDEAMQFFDCSLEKSGWYTIPKKKLFVAPFYSLPPQSIGLREGFYLDLAREEFAIIAPENIHVVRV